MFTMKKIFSDGAILLQNTENDVSGTAGAGKEITITLMTKDGDVFSSSVRADEDGRWRVTLPPVAGGFKNYELHAECGSERITAHNVRFGELFHISGQSNMELPMRRTRDPFGHEPLPSDYPYIREFRVPITCRFSKTEVSEDFSGGFWKSAVGSDLWDMSAAGYYFAEDIFKRLNVPVGLVNTAAGGADAESFMPYEMIKSYGIHDDFLEEATRENYIKETSERDAERERQWLTALGTEDFGLVPSDDMKSCTVPCQVNELDGLDGFSGRIFFFRKFFIPEDFPLSGTELILGTITDSDTAYINGIKVGETGYMYPPRYYPVADGVLKHGENILAVRIEIKCGSGGFTKGRRLCLRSEESARTINLGGEWQYAVAAKAEAMEPSVFFQGLPLALHADMMYPAMQFRYRALLWYQGESNCGRADMYSRMFKDLISYYRKTCGYEIPVIITQLCDHEGMNGYDPSQSWARLRQEQLECLDIPDTAMAVTIDVGEYNDLHPTNKRAVGKRLAYCAGGLLYGDNTVFVRCIKASAAASENGTDITLFLDGDAYLKNNRTGAFEIIFTDGTYRCEETPPQKCGKTIMLRTAHKGEPLAVRYAWRNAPYELDLYDIETKPVSPFEIKLREE